MADDEVSIQRMLRRRLVRAGYEVYVVSNGQDALSSVMEIQPDLTLMDMHMPVMDGYTAVRSLRKKGYKGVIAALTASATPADMPKAIQAGCDHFIPKPIGQDFESIIKRLVSQ